MKKFNYLALTLLLCIKVYAQKSFETRLSGWQPVLGVQLKDSTFRVITNGKPHAPSLKRMETHHIDKDGLQIQKIGIGVPNCVDNIIYDVVADNKAYLYVSGQSVICPVGGARFLYVLNALADSIKYIEYDTSRSLNSFYRLSVNSQGSLMSTYGNRIFIYNNAHQKLLITDTLPFKYGIVLQKANNSGFIALYDGRVVNINLHGNITGSFGFYTIDTTASTFTFSEVKLIESTGDILVNYRKLQPTDSQWTDALALLDSNLNVKWVHTIPNTTAKIQTAYPYKTQCVVRPNNTFLVIKHKDTEQFISRTLLLHHIDMNGNLFKVDSIQLRPPESAFSATLVLTSAVNTFDGGLFLTITQHFWDAYSMSPYLIKTDSNLQLPHRLNTSVRSNMVSGSFNLYPNPNTTGLLHLRFPEEYSLSQHATLNIWNTLGQQVKTVSGTLESLQQVNIEDVQPGCYAVEFITEGGRYKSKLLVSGD